MNEVRIRESVWKKTLSHLLPDDAEHIAFLLAESVNMDGIVFFVKDVILIRDEDTETAGLSIQVKLPSLLEVINHANKNGLCLIEIHNHGLFHDDVDFSNTDRKGFEDFVPYILSSLPGKPYGALVVNPKESVNGIVWKTKDDSEGILRVRIVGDNYKKYITSNAKRFSTYSGNSGIHSRQIQAFGKEGQKLINSLKIGIVGAGGIGSHVIQQLSYLGVNDFVVIDEDNVEESNLNRLVGANKDDVGKPKIMVAKRVINFIRGTESKIKIIQKDLRNFESFDELKKCDIILGCVDNEGARLILNQLSFSYLIHYIDCATGINMQNDEIESAGGRVVVLQPDGPCLECANLLERKEAYDNLTTQEDFENRKRLGYVDGADIPDPSVISLNGTIASIAINELLMLVTGIRPVKFLTMYDMLEARESLVQRVVKINENCIHHIFIGIGNKVHLERHIKKEVIK